MPMKYVIRIIFRSLICSLVFCVLLGKVSFLGIFCGIFASLVFSYLVSHIQDNDTPHFRGVWSFRYYFLLFRDMVTATFKVSRSIFSKTLPSISILHEPASVNDSGKVLVSNSITLTPGTVTLEENDDGYTILHLQEPKALTDITSVSDVFETRIPERTICHDD